MATAKSSRLDCWQLKLNVLNENPSLVRVYESEWPWCAREQMKVKGSRKNLAPDLGLDASGWLNAGFKLTLWFVFGSKIRMYMMRFIEHTFV